MKYTNLFFDTAVSLYHYFFPDICIICCREIHKSSKLKICSNCLEKIPETTFKNSNNCKKCSRKLISENDICTYCRRRNYLFLKNISIWSYSDETVKNLIHNYKFRNIRSASFFLSEKIKDFYFHFFRGFAVIPVPCSRKRKKNTGWDHMSVIASCLLKSDIAVYSILKRKKGKEQKKLDSKERLANSSERFYIKKNFNTSILSNYKGILIIDDIFTTGSTVNECTKIILKTACNNNIHILTIALD